jgi:hypothetical protein
LVLDVGSAIAHKYLVWDALICFGEKLSYQTKLAEDYLAISWDCPSGILLNVL